MTHRIEPGTMRGHRAIYRSWTRGYHPVLSMSGRQRKQTGTFIKCECGWTHKSNEDRPRAMRVYLRHLETYGVGRFGFGAARVQ